VTGTFELFWLFYLTGDPFTEPFLPLVLEKLTSDIIVVDKSPPPRLLCPVLTGEELVFLALLLIMLD
jgi:hypothetical protein